MGHREKIVFVMVILKIVRIYFGWGLIAKKARKAKLLQEKMVQMLELLMLICQSSFNFSVICFL